MSFENRFSCEVLSLFHNANLAMILRFDDLWADRCASAKYHKYVANKSDNPSADRTPSLLEKCENGVSKFMRERARSGPRFGASMRGIVRGS